MELFLLRHGIAVERDTPGIKDDFERPLTAKGRRQLRQSGAALRRWKVKFDLMLTSPLVRARETASIIAKQLKCERRVRISENLQPGTPPTRLIAELKALRPQPEKILLVGHEPDLGELIALLVTGRATEGFALKKGGLAKLEIEKLRTGRCATLACLVTPKLLGG